MPELKANILIFESEDGLAVYWTLNPKAPYLTGESETDFDGPYSSVENALGMLKNLNPDLEDKNISHLRLTDSEPEFFEETTISLSLDFELPLDEVTEHFLVQDSCPLAASFTTEVDVSLQSKHPQVSILSAGKGDYLLSCKDKPSTGPVTMRQCVRVTLKHPRCITFLRLVPAVHAQVRLAPYYPGRFDAKVDFFAFH